MEIEKHGVAPAIRVPTDSPFLKAAIEALRVPFDKEPLLMGSGGSIPVVGSIQRILGFESLLVGFGLDDDRIHSPNEKFELRCYLNGAKSHAAMLAQFASMTG
jgi:acetylornithine deacetylase/succinyl-diaminopimelate desuccinylase-like protein